MGSKEEEALVLKVTMGWDLMRDLGKDLVGSLRKGGIW